MSRDFVYWQPNGTLILRADVADERWARNNGGMRTGQVIGSTNRLGEYALDRPVDYQNVFATLYRNLGIDVSSTKLPDHNGRPQYLLDKHEPIWELI